MVPRYCIQLPQDRNTSQKTLQADRTTRGTAQPAALVAQKKAKIAAQKDINDEPESQEVENMEPERWTVGGCKSKSKTFYAL
jgi:hypothetical protein